MPKVVLTKKYGDLKKGTVVNASKSLANTLINRLKVAELQKEQDKA